MAINAQIQALTVAMATSPAASAAILPQVLELQRQQAAIITGMATAGAGGGGGGGGVAVAPSQVASGGVLAAGGFNFMMAPSAAAPAPAGPLGLNGLPLTRGLPPPVNQPTPATTAPKAHDPFDFASKDLFGGL